ncbi:hypothetical protein TNCT_569751 [Trichonephila clavata]|uniref:Uncharacterized protein n=1 Tax=Trichonephila clavata TaxID=2740835 RepID=A0A8X6FGR6_TRICU|nr:hypothetical protein TNCT_569751 [Trichonephila clavata]
MYHIVEFRIKKKSTHVDEGKKREGDIKVICIDGEGNQTHKFLASLTSEHFSKTASKLVFSGSGIEEPVRKPRTIYRHLC